MRWFSSTVLGLASGYCLATLYSMDHTQANERFHGEDIRYQHTIDGQYAIAKQLVCENNFLAGFWGITIANCISLGTDFYNGYTSKKEVKCTFTKVLDDEDNDVSQNSVLVEYNGTIKLFDGTDVLCKLVQCALPIAYCITHKQIQNSIMPGTVFALTLNIAIQFASDLLSIQPISVLQFDDMDMKFEDNIEYDNMLITNIYTVDGLIIS